MPQKIRNYATDPDLRERAAKVASAWINKSEGQRGDLVQEWNQADALWRRESISEMFTAEEVKHVPEPYNRVEIIVPRLYAGVFGVGPWFTVLARNPSYIKQEGSVTELITWQCSLDDWRFYSDQEDGIRQLAIYGTVVFKLDWFSRDVRVAEREIKTKKTTAPGGELIAEEEVRGGLNLTDKTEAFPRARPLKLRNVYMDRYCDNLQECEYIGDLFELPLQEVERRGKLPPDEGGYVNVAEIIEKHKRTREKSDSPDSLDKIRFYAIWTTLTIRDQPRKVVIICAGEKSDDQVTKISAEGIVRIAENTFPGAFYPYAVGRYIKRPGEMYGVGAVIPVRGISAELDDWRTLQMRAAELMVSPPFISRDAAELEGEQLFLWPGRVIPSPMGREGLEKVDVGYNYPAAFNIEQQFRRDIAQTSKAPDAWMGMGEAGRETAFEIGRRLQESGVSLGRIIGRYRTEVLKPILRNFLALNNMYLEEPVQIRKLGTKAYRGKPFRKISPQDIQSQFDFEILDISEIALLGNSTRQWVAFLQAMPPELMQVARWDKVFKDVLKSMGREDPEQYVFMQPDEDDLLSAAEEHTVIGAGHDPPVLPQHNHLLHISLHEMFKTKPQYAEWTQQKQAVLDAHERDHQKQIAQQFERMMQAASQVALGGPAPAQAQAGGGAQRPRVQQRAGPRGVTAPTAQANQLRQIAGQNQGRP